jgi:phosphoribosylanthranilate isomerase
MILKVCGMKYPDNVKAVAELLPDYMGFIFYKPTKRYCGETLSPELVKSLPSSIIKTGVFVDEKEEEVLTISKAYDLQAIQLHGHESPEYCLSIKKNGLQVIKAFHIDEKFDWETLEPYNGVADFFLFDTKTDLYGGSGLSFDWGLLTKYNNKVPLFLSGGMDERILEQLNTMPVFALDINSKFEIEPGLKDVERIKKFKESLSQISEKY